uniref:Uncharacterized protein n=1 Tax=Panagrellus redivivus TaxID=6233 RepID=A0A7E4ZTI5_PANRE
MASIEFERNCESDADCIFYLTDRPLQFHCYLPEVMRSDENDMGTCVTKWDWSPMYSNYFPPSENDTTLQGIKKEIKKASDLVFL